MSDIETRINEIVDRTKEIVSKNLSIDISRVTPDASFVEDLGADSLDLVEVIMALEEEFGVEIPDEEAEKLKTVAASNNLYTNIYQLQSRQNKNQSKSRLVIHAKSCSHRYRCNHPFRR